MQNETFFDFGLVIAYILPGCLVLAGLSFVNPVIAAWISGSLGTAALGSFLFVILAAVGAGLTASTVRWLLVDTIHHRTGIPLNHGEFQYLAERTEAYSFLIEIHYRYYQFYANMLIAGWFAYGCWRWHESDWGIIDGTVLPFSLLFWVASRNTLRNYYIKTRALLSQPD